MNIFLGGGLSSGVGYWDGFVCQLPTHLPITIMEAAFGRLHNSGVGAFGARPTVVESILVDREAANIEKTYRNTY